jgi:hypothetical protein
MAFEVIPPLEPGFRLIDGSLLNRLVEICNLVIASSFNLDVEIPINGDVIQTTTDTGSLRLAPASDLSTLTVILPPNPSDTQIFELSTSRTINLLTLAATAPDVIVGSAGGPFTLAANGGASWQFSSSGLTWYPRY